MSSTPSLPRSVVSEDRQLDETQSKVAERLLWLRWHWTLDESNEKRVSYAEYARAVGKNETTIRRDARAHGYVEPTNPARTRRTPDEARGRALMGEETQAATEAVAEARGVKFQTARNTYPVEIRRVREIARQRAEDKDTSVEEEAPAVARTIAVREHQEAERAEERSGDLRFVQMEQHLYHARRPLLEALELARDLEWSEEHRELLEQTIAQLRALLGLINVAIVGEADVDWDAELAKLAPEEEGEQA